jgi:DNA polymerase-3 subunit chi
MTEVIFVTGVTDVVETARQLVCKKHREAARLAVFGPAELLRKLDLALWDDAPPGFLPHIHVVSGAALSAAQLALTPVWLLEQPLKGIACDSAINVGFDDATAFLSFERVAELVGTGPAEREAGRRRWKRYDAQGCNLRHHVQSNT